MVFKLGLDQPQELHTEKESLSCLTRSPPNLSVLAGFLQVSFAKGKTVPLMKSERQRACGKTGALRRGRSIHRAVTTWRDLGRVPRCTQGLGMLGRELSGAWASPIKRPWPPRTHEGESGHTSLGTEEMSGNVRVGTRAHTRWTLAENLRLSTPRT